MTDAVPDPTAPAAQVILPRVHDLGDGFQVRRALPSAMRRMVGPFVFFDQLGPVILGPGSGQDVRPHPHIGLSTLTWLFEGEIRHRDSAGHVETIRAGEVNWMTAGRGIVHSERTPPERRVTGGGLFGQQIWIALPRASEETDPGFTHHTADSLPRLDGDGATATIVAGEAFGLRSPVPTFSDLMFVDVVLADGARFHVPADHAERAAFVISGAVSIAGQTGTFEEMRLVVFAPGAEIVLEAHGPTRLTLIGGEPFPEKRHIYWNFVSSSKDRIEAAKADWRAGRFPGIAGETEFIPLPPDPPGVVWKD
ncbi:pirin family protein [Siculibacillus lacustris]|uniref:Pirin family protein n=1 Tax=Siculibacillus lacustris TaxID=1549641 RepID=A0A4Q9VI51_9HYPH|nr:pirin family protein [Siculibacillus lacustris]TBW34755.1 pirin family protein [Siculibacillus lacustris]